MRCVTVHEDPSSLSDDGQDSRPAGGYKVLQTNAEVQALHLAKVHLQPDILAWKVTQAHCQVCLHPK